MIYSAGIIGLGKYLPERIVTNRELEELVDTSDEWITTRTGISERRIAAAEQATSDLAIAAAQEALLDARLGADELDLIIVATISPDMIFPATACLVQAALGATKAAAFDLSAGCSGYVYALITAAQFIAAGLYQNVLVVGADTLSRLTDWQDRRTCVLFGDGAAAAVVGRVPDGYGILGSLLGADGTGGNHLYLPAGGSRRPASPETLENREHYIKMSGPEVFKFAVKVMEEATLQVIEQAGLTLADIDLFVPHQANIRIIDSSLHRMGVPHERVFLNVDKYGNTSAASVGIALAEAVAAGRVHDGDNILLVGFGAGLTWGSAVLKWYDRRQLNG
ncbi:MAG: ketoacyl-ACP synthase III [Firmicutes bacterium]|nr:ketoacyl-ACP synthase III [Bacillota bacterium]